MAARVIIVLAVAIAAVLAVPSTSRYDRINSIQNLWTAGHNEITDKGMAYMKKVCGVLETPEGERLPVKEDLEIEENIPASFDARIHWPHCPSINSIKNQGECGSCWAVAATSSMSDRLCIASHNKIRVNISAENVMCCCSACSITGGCDGGYPDKAWNYLLKTGAVTGGDYQSHEGCQPYEIAPTSSSDYYTPPCHKSCTNKKYGKSYRSDLHFDKSAYALPKSVQKIQSDILKNGPVEATFDVYDDFFDYQTGVYVHTSDFLVGRHAVRVLGWGRENGQNYWLVANSWGRAWGGLNGLFKILRGTNECRFEEGIVAGLTKH